MIGGGGGSNRDLNLGQIFGVGQAKGIRTGVIQTNKTDG
jgi:hypothetical protein